MLYSHSTKLTDTLRYMMRTLKSRNSFVRFFGSPRTTPVFEMVQLSYKDVLHHGQYKTFRVFMPVLFLRVIIWFRLLYETAHVTLLILRSVSWRNNPSFWNNRIRFIYSLTPQKQLEEAGWTLCKVKWAGESWKCKRRGQNWEEMFQRFTFRLWTV